MKLSRTLLVGIITTLSVSLQLTAHQSGNLEKAGTIIGMVITDARNQRIGKVKDLAVDWQEGRIAEVLVDTSGFLTSKPRIVAVPPQFFTLADSNEELRMSGDINVFDNAPEFDISTWKLSTTDSSVADVYLRFHAKPYPQMGNLELASKIMGLTAWNEWTQRMGKTEDFVVDLPSGRIPVVLFAPTGFLGIGIKKGELTAVPPQAFLYDPDSNTLLLDTTKKTLRNAPHFKPSDWRIAVNNTNSFNLSSVYDTFQSLRSRDTEDNGNAVPATTTVNPTNENDTQGDAVITLEIEHKIMAANGLSDDARHVQVSTLKGRVTLRGIADSEKEKQQLGAIAASVVPASHVDNKIEVKLLAITMTQVRFQPTSGQHNN